MGLLDTDYASLQSKKPKRSDRIYPDEPLNVRGLLDAATNIPVVGDALSGGMAIYDAAKGNYGSAAINALGVLPFVSAAPLVAMKAIDKAAKLKGVTTEAGRLAKVYPGQAGHIVWHGSPHNFNKFDMSKIGTGEGAQAYGHGLYFAQAPQVAKDYQKKLTVAENYVDGEILDPFKPKHLLASVLDQESGSVENALDTLMLMADRGASKSVKESAKQAIDILKKGELPRVEYVKPEGSLYKVDIPDEAVARFLDWDKPLSQQAPEVQAAIKSQMPENAWNVMQNRKGQDYVEHYWNGGIGGSGQSYMASQRMSELGIPGIRYLDGGSRGAGQGSSNFVLFDDQMPRILEINGNPTGNKPWSPGEWNGLLGK